jgi:alkylhydroperoxidase/carboxymuconolactone decarboxylase family protein YurZ
MSDYTERLRRLATNDPRALSDELGGTAGAATIDARTLALVRLASLIAVGGSEPSFGEHADAAIDAGASTSEIVDVLVGITPVVGLPRVVSAAPSLARALGVDVESYLD